MPKHFRDSEKMLVGGGVVMPKYFTDLKNVGGGGGRLTCAWQYFGTLIFELFFEIIRSSVDKIYFLFYADNLKVSTIVSIIFFLEKWFKFCVKIGFEVENLC